jgi:hypothetical protein
MVGDAGCRWYRLGIRGHNKCSEWKYVRLNCVSGRAGSVSGGAVSSHQKIYGKNGLSAVERLEVLTKTDPDVVLLDIDLPDTSGLDILDEIIQRPSAVSTSPYLQPAFVLLVELTG